MWFSHPLTVVLQTAPTATVTKDFAVCDLPYDNVLTGNSNIILRTEVRYSPSFHTVILTSGHADLYPASLRYMLLNTVFFFHLMSL